MVVWCEAHGGILVVGDGDWIVGYLCGYGVDVVLNLFGWCWIVCLFFVDEPILVVVDEQLFGGVLLCVVVILVFVD